MFLIVFCLYKIRAYNRGYNTHCPEHQGKHNTYCPECGSAENHSRHERNLIRLENIRGHTRAVPYIVTDIIRYCSGVPRVILRYILLDFSHKVSPYISRLCENSAAYPHKKGQEASAETESDKYIGNS